MAEKYLTKSGLVTVKNEIDAKYQKKESGKGLSANDYTTDEKTKLAGIASGAEVNVIQGITVNGAEQAPASNTRAVNIAVPTKTSDLTNDSDYQTAAEVQSIVNSSIGSITGVSFSIVDALPETGNGGTFYFVANSSGKNENIYDEYVYITKTGSSGTSTSSWEKIGTTDVDLSGYVKTSDIDSITNSEIDEIFNS